MSRNEELFKDFLCICDFGLEKYDDGYGVVDLQGANLGDIESDRFQTAESIADRMDIYISDMLEDDLSEELGITDYSNLTELVQKAKLHAKAEQYRQDIDILEMIVNGCKDIKLENCLN